MARALVPLPPIYRMNLDLPNIITSLIGPSVVSSMRRTGKRRLHREIGGCTLIRE